MRQRTVKNLEEKINNAKTYLIEDPRSLKGKWHEEFGNSNPIYIEIGCGKGKFILKKAELNPNANFIAVEGQDSVCLRALEKAEENDRQNIRIFIDFVNDMNDYFEKGEIEGVYLNFSDPWPKSRHDKRRLTYHGRLLNYAEVMNGGFVEFKTDNDKLYDFTLGEISLIGMKPKEETRDLINSNYESRLVTTEYEEKFEAMGKNINYVKIEFEDKKMGETSFACMRGRQIPKEDRLFGINQRAKKKIAELGKENVVDATLGVLLDDKGELIVLSSVDEVMRSLSKSEYAAYAPISGVPEFRENVKKAVFLSYTPSGYSEAVATPGGTGAIRNTFSNYSEVGDRILIPNWFWAPYKQIANEIERDVEVFTFFNEDGAFNDVDFEKKIEELLIKQNHLIIVLNTPAHNPTGYRLSKKEWLTVRDIIEKHAHNKKITLLIDSAYIDFAGDPIEMREFLPIVDTFCENVLVVIAYSLSKTFTLYGMRGGAMICLTKSKEIAEEFKKVNEYSSRASWSNSARAPQMILTKIFKDEKLRKKVDEERLEIREMLLRRGKAFEERAKEIGLKTLPFRGGFFLSIPTEDPDALSKKLEEKNIFLVPLANGVRVSIAAISEETAKKLPDIILGAMKEA